MFQSAKTIRKHVPDDETSVTEGRVRVLVTKKGHLLAALAKHTETITETGPDVTSSKTYCERTVNVLLVDRAGTYDEVRKAMLDYTG